MNTSARACRACGHPLAGGTADHFADTLADVRGPQQPPEAAGLLAGATPADAQLGQRSGPVEYSRGDEGLCSACRTQRATEKEPRRDEPSCAGRARAPAHCGVAGECPA